MKEAAGAEFEVTNTADCTRYLAYVKHSEAALEWAEMLSEPILFGCEHIDDSGFGWLILMEK